MLKPLRYIRTSFRLVFFLSTSNLGEPIVLGLVNTALSLEQEGYRAEADTVIKLCQKLFPCPVSQYSQVLYIRNVVQYLDLLNTSLELFNPNVFASVG